jgi:hypothetical protein
VERVEAFENRETEIRDLASKVREASTKAWKKPLAFALSLGGAAVSVATGNPFGALFAAASALAGFQSPDKPDVGAYSYLFQTPRTYW